MVESDGSRQEPVNPGGFGSTVTILFTDIRGFTDFTDERGDEAAYRMLQHHNALVEEQIAIHGGHVVKTLGDSFMVSFDAARTAVACAVAIQRAVDRHNTTQEGVRIAVGIGIDTGEPVRQGEDLFGGAVNLASRTCAAAGPGEILISETTRRVTGKIEGIEYVDRGSLQLKGFQEPRHLFEVGWSNQAGDATIGGWTGSAPRATTAQLAAQTGGRKRPLLVAAAAVALVGAVAAAALLFRAAAESGSGPPQPEVTGPPQPEVAGPRSSARLLLADDFSEPSRGAFMDNLRGVERGTFSDGTAFDYHWESLYADGALVVRVTGPFPPGPERPRPYQGVAAADRVFGDFAVEVRARATASVERARYGIDYVLTGEDRYRLEVAPAIQRYGISLGPLRRNFMAGDRSSAVSRGDAENHIRMEVRGRTLKAFVNGTEVDRGEHEGLATRGGSIELIVGLFGPAEEAAVEARFTDFRLYSLDP